MTEWHNKSPQHQAPSHKEVMAFDERAYEQISAEILFSLPICVIMVLTKSLPPGGSLWTCATLGV